MRWVIGLTLLILIGVGATQEGRKRAPAWATPAQPLSTNLLDLQLGPAGSPASDERTLAINKLAEMIALSRHSDGCPGVPREWSIALILLQSVNSLTEEQIAAKEDEVLALRTKIGDEKWCLLYAVEMKEAYLVVQYIIQDR